MNSSMMMERIGMNASTSLHDSNTSSASNPGGHSRQQTILHPQPQPRIDTSLSIFANAKLQSSSSYSAATLPPHHPTVSLTATSGSSSSSSSSSLSSSSNSGPVRRQLRLHIEEDDDSAASSAANSARTTNPNIVEFTTSGTFRLGDFFINQDGYSFGEEEKVDQQQQQVLQDEQADERKNFVGVKRKIERSESQDSERDKKKIMDKEENAATKDGPQKRTLEESAEALLSPKRRKISPRGCFEVTSLSELESLSLIGQGSSGVVHLSRHRPSGRLVALKVIPITNDLTETKSKQVLTELRTLHLSTVCPYIVGFHGAFYRERAITLVLEYLDGGTLADALKAHFQRVRERIQAGDEGGAELELRRSPIPEAIIAHIALSVLRGLRFLHAERRLIHRDIKPSNILLSTTGQVKIADFSVSGELSAEAREKLSFVGTVTYMSPERIQGQRHGFDSDLWSLGLMVLECTMGRFPYHMHSQQQHNERERERDGLHFKEKVKEKENNGKENAQFTPTASSTSSSSSSSSGMPLVSPSSSAFGGSSAVTPTSASSSSSTPPLCTALSFLQQNSDLLYSMSPTAKPSSSVSTPSSVASSPCKCMTPLALSQGSAYDNITPASSSPAMHPPATHSLPSSTSSSSSTAPPGTSASAPPSALKPPAPRPKRRSVFGFWDMMEKIVSSPAPRLPGWMSELYSPKLADFIEKCLQKEPERRSSAQSMMEHEWIREWTEKMEEKDREQMMAEWVKEMKEKEKERHSKNGSPSTFTALQMNGHAQLPATTPSGQQPPLAPQQSSFIQRLQTQLNAIASGVNNASGNVGLGPKQLQVSPNFSSPITPMASFYNATQTATSASPFFPRKVPIALPPMAPLPPSSQKSSSPTALSICVDSSAVHSATTPTPSAPTPAVFLSVFSPPSNTLPPPLSIGSAASSPSLSPYPSVLSALSSPFTPASTYSSSSSSSLLPASAGAASAGSTTSSCSASKATFSFSERLGKKEARTMFAGLMAMGMGIGSSATQGQLAEEDRASKRRRVDSQQNQHDSAAEDGMETTAQVNVTSDVQPPVVQSSPSM